VLRSLNQSIRGLLKALTPYFLLRPSLKVLEFLIRTYSVQVVASSPSLRQCSARSVVRLPVNAAAPSPRGAGAHGDCRQEHNVDDLLMCTLPYHSTPQFVRLVHLIEPKGRWLFLNGVKKTGAPLSRTVLASCCAADRAVLTFICELAKEPGAPRVVLGLFVSTCVELLATQRKVPEDMTLAIFPVLLEGLRSSTSTELQAAAYMVLATLVKKATLAPEVLKTVLEIIPKYASREAPMPALLLLVAVCHYQRPATLSEAAIQSILRMRDLASKLAEVAKEVDASHLTSLLVPALVRKAPTDNKCLADLRAIVAEVPLGAALVQLIARELTRMCRRLHSSRERGLSSPREHPGVQQLAQVLCEVANRYPSQMDAFITGQLSSKKGADAMQQDDDSDEESSGEGSSDEDEGAAPAKYKGAERDWLMSFLAKTFHGTRHSPVEEAGTTLLLALEHPAQAVRLAAINRLGKTIKAEAPPSFLAEALLRRIEDDEAAVALAALSWDKLASVVPAEPLVRALSAVADAESGKHRMATASDGAAVREQALRVLASPLLEQHPHLVDHATKVLLRHIIVYPKSRRRNTLALKLAAAVSHPLLRGLGEVLKQWKASRSDAPESSTPRGKDKEDKGKRPKTPAKAGTAKPEGESSTWDLNLRVVDTMSSNLVKADSEERAAMLALLASSGARLLQALVLSRVIAGLKGADQVHATESLCAVLETSAEAAAASATASEEDMAVDGDASASPAAAELTPQVLEALFPVEVVTRAASWHRLRLSLWRAVLQHLQPSNKLALDCAGQLVLPDGAAKGQRQLLLLRRLFVAFTAAPSVADYTAHIKKLLEKLGAETALPFLTWFIRDGEISKP